MAQFPATPRQQPWTGGVMNSPRPSSSQWPPPAAASRGGASTVTTAQHRSSAEWAAMAQQWASSRKQPTTPRQTPGDATPLIDET